MSRSGRESLRMSRSCPDTLPEVQKDLLEVRKDLPAIQEWSGGPPGCPAVVVMPSRMSGSGREALPDVREWSGGPTGCPGVVLIPSRMSGWTSRMSGSDREVLPDVQEWPGVPPHVQELP